MHLMHQTMRWYGPNDKVSLADIRQAGCSGVVTALHQIAVGEIWPIDAINERKNLIEAAGMSWTVVESLPVHEDIKKQTGHYKLFIENYKISIQNLSACGITVVTYNFMPVLDWLRTDIAYPMPDGSKALYFERSAFIAFDIFLLKRPNAANDYTASEVAKATQRFTQMPAAEKEQLFTNLLLGLPGSDDSFTVDTILNSLKEYEGISTAKLKEHLYYFLQQIVPVAEKSNIKLAIHPDDPPYQVLGLPRIVCTEQDVANLLDAVPSAANGLCFCTGSFGASANNDLVKMIKRFKNNIHFLHLRSTKRDDEGNFYEAGHLAGDADMYGIIKELLVVMQQRNCTIPMRPDHGHQMLNDLSIKTYPGYTAIGRLKGLAELRGVEYAISKAMEDVEQ